MEKMSADWVMIPGLEQLDFSTTSRSSLTSDYTLVKQV
jgi:hypothetical protein